MRTPKLDLILWIAAAFVILLWPGGAFAASGERILNYESKMEVMTDASMIVTETITVLCAGNEIKRGIFRTFPTTYSDRMGNTVRVAFKVLEVLRDGAPEPYHVKNVSNGKAVYIGQKDVLLSPGEYVYTLKYKTDRQLGFFDSFDELYWNVTGNSWSFPIDRAEAVVVLPGRVEIINQEAYTGRRGESGQDFLSGFDGLGNPRFETTRRLNPGEGLTIAVSWPQGYVERPGSGRKLSWLFFDNLFLFAGLGGLTVLMCYYIVVWYLVGRDPQKGVIIPLYSPPKGFSPAAVRFVSRMGFDKKAFSCAVVDLAVKGGLAIEEEEGNKFSLRRMEPKTPISSGERKVHESLFKNAESVRLAQSNHAVLGRAVNALKKSLQTDFEKIHFRKNSVWLAPGIVITLLALGAIAISAAGEENKILAAFMSVWLTGWTMAVYFLVSTALRSFRYSSGKNRYLPLLFALPFVAFEFVGLGAYAHATSLPTMLLMLCLLLTNVIFYYLLKAPTVMGRLVMDQIDGFKRFLSVTEEERLDLVHPPDRTPRLFEKYLPYALALEVEHKWSEQFSDILAQASVEGKTYSPAWYHGRGFDTLGPAGLADSLGGGFSGAISSSSTPPGSSSGSGGGGSSGGGGGGGGGGGW